MSKALAQLLLQHEVSSAGASMVREMTDKSSSKEGFSPWLLVAIGVGALVLGVALIGAAGMGLIPAGEQSGRLFFLPFAVGLALVIAGLWSVIKRERITGPVRKRTTPGDGLTGYVVTVWVQGRATEHTVYANSVDHARRMVPTNQYAHITGIRRL